MSGEFRRHDGSARKFGIVSATQFRTHQQCRQRRATCVRRERGESLELNCEQELQSGNRI